MSGSRRGNGVSSYRTAAPGAGAGVSTNETNSLQQSIFREALLQREPLFDEQNELSVMVRLLSPDGGQQRRRYRWDRSPASSSTRQAQAAASVSTDTPKLSGNRQPQYAYDRGATSVVESRPDPEGPAVEEPLVSPIRWASGAVELSQTEVRQEMEVPEFIRVFSPSANIHRGSPSAAPVSGSSNDPSSHLTTVNESMAGSRNRSDVVVGPQLPPPRLNPATIQQVSSPAVQSPSTVTAEFGPATPSSLIMQAWSPTPSASTIEGGSASRALTREPSNAFPPGVASATSQRNPAAAYSRRTTEVSTSSIGLPTGVSTIQREGIFSAHRPQTSSAHSTAFGLPSLSLPADHTLFAPRPRQVLVDRDEQSSVPAASVSLSSNPANASTVKPTEKPVAIDETNSDQRLELNGGTQSFNHEPLPSKISEAGGAYFTNARSPTPTTGVPRTLFTDMPSKSIQSPIPNVSSRLRDTFLRHAPDRAYAVGRSLGVDMVYEAKHAARRKIQLERELDEIHAAEKQRRDQIRSDEAHERVQLQIILRRRILLYHLHQIEHEEAIARHILALGSEHEGWLSLLEQEESARAVAATNERNRLSRAEHELDEQRHRKHICAVREDDFQTLVEAEWDDYWRVIRVDLETEECLKRERCVVDEARQVEDLLRLERQERAEAADRESLRLKLEAIAEALRATERSEEEDREMITTMEWSARSGLELRAEELRHLYLKEVATFQAMELMKRLQTQRADLESKELAERNAAIIVDFELNMAHLMEDEILDRFRVQRLLVEQAEQIKRRDIVYSVENEAFLTILESERTEREIAFGMEQGRKQRYFEKLFADLNKAEEQRRKELESEASEQWNLILATEATNRQQLLMLAQSRALADRLRSLEQLECDTRSKIQVDEDQIYTRLTQDSWKRLQILSFFDSHRQTRFEIVEEEIKERKRISQLAETERLDALERQRKRKEEEAKASALKQLREKALRQGKPFVGFGLAEKVDSSTFSTRSLRKPTDQPHIVVDSMYLDGPAHVEGLHLNDLVESVGGEKCLNLVQIRQVISEKAKVGQKLLIMVKRMVREAPRESTTSPTPQDGRSKSNGMDGTAGEMAFLVTQSDDDEVRSEGGTSLGALSAVSSTMGNMVEKSLTFCVSVRTAEKEFAPLEDLFFDTSSHEKIERGNSATRASLSRTSSGMRLASNSPSPAGSVASDGRSSSVVVGVPGAPGGTHLLVPPAASFRRSSAPTGATGGGAPSTPSKENSIRKPVVEIVSPGKSIPAKNSMHGKPPEKPKK